MKELVYKKTGKPLTPLKTTWCRAHMSGLLKAGDLGYDT
jgi:hypothetical protein